MRIVFFMFSFSFGCTLNSFILVYFLLISSTANVSFDRFPTRVSFREIQNYAAHEKQTVVVHHCASL